MEKHINKSLSERFSSFSRVASRIGRSLREAFLTGVSYQVLQHEQTMREMRFLDPDFAEAERQFKSYWDDWVSAERAQIARDLGGEKAKPAIFLAKGESEIPFLIM